MRVFEFYDGETTWIAARTEEEAIDFFLTEWAEDSSSDPDYTYEHKECLGDYLDKKFLRSDGPDADLDPLISLREALELCNASTEYPYPSVVGSTVY